MSSLVGVAAILAGVLAIYAQTSVSMVDAWRESTTYSHGFLILPIFLWLVWERRSTLARLPMQPWWPGLLAISAIGSIWLTSRLAFAAEPSQIALVALVPAVVATLLGRAWVCALAFPFAFLFFAVPFGDSLIPPMIDWTADFVVAALRLCGVPVHRDGNDFSIPSGDWSVVDACSGIRYVFACLTVSSLYAWTMYRGIRRRLVFICAALATVVVANWLRAFAIVMLAHFSDNKLALGIDHFIYGSVFFVAVIAVLFSLGALWREPAVVISDPAPPTDAASPSRATSLDGRASMRGLAASFAAAAVLVLWPLLLAGTERGSQQASAPTGEIAPRLGWRLVDEPVTAWKPQLRDPLSETTRTFEKNARRVTVYVAMFDRPTPEAKLASSANRLVEPADPRWKQVRRGSAEASTGGGVVSVRTGTLVGQGQRVIVWHWYWVDGTMTTSPARVAFLQILARIRGHSERSAWVIAATLQEDPASSHAPALETFFSDMLESVDASLKPGDPPEGTGKSG